MMLAGGQALAGADRPYEQFPRGLVAFGQAIAPVIGGPVFRLTVGRGAFAGNPAARAALVKGLRPLDLIAMTNEGKWVHRILPGHFSHVAVWLGGKRDLAALGLAPHPAFAPVMNGPDEARWVLEANPPRVQITRLERALPATQAMALRVKAGDRQRTQALIAMAQKLGRPFDYRYDLKTPARIYCTELVVIGLPHLAARTHRIYGVETLLPDDFAEDAMAGRNGLSLIRIIKAGPGGAWRTGSPAAIRAAIRAERDRR